MPFLADHDLRPLTLPEGRGLRPVGLALGQGLPALEVAVTEAGGRPTLSALRSAWKDRRASRAVPLLLVALYDDRAALCGPSGENPTAFVDLDPGQVERICRTALAEPDRHAALRFLQSVIPEVESPLPGLRNMGLLAAHALRFNVPGRPDWAAAAEKAKRALTARGEALLRELGYEIKSLPGPGSVLVTRDTKVAVAVFLERSQAFEVPGELFSGVSPVSYALREAERERVPYVILSSGPVLRLYSAKPSVGPGSRGRTETYLEAHLDLLPEDRAAYLWLLFSGDALSSEGTFQEILAESERYAADLGKDLRERIHYNVVQQLAMAVAAARGLRKPDRKALDETYQLALTVLFRLLFIAYAEDQERLPYSTDGLYRTRSLKEKAKELREVISSGRVFDTGTSRWEEVEHLFRAVEKGHKEWGVPEYNGGLFSSDPSFSPAGAALEKVKLTNDVFGPILADLLLEEGRKGGGPVDFRSLGVREFGTIYEGLLENELSLAETHLQVGADGHYQPTHDPARAAVKKGEIYLHSRAGTRKSTGSYFTKSFAVEHLLDHSLEPALDDHLARLDAMPEREAGEAFFDFRVADIAMGSGHFLVAALDRIERRFADYLSKRRLPEVIQELSRLRSAATKALKEVGQEFDIEDAQLLRRQIARRCIYGVDLNLLAVELARLSIWIHTFVPGLPLSFLDHNLVCGNSLAGIATIEEAQELAGAAAGDLFSFTAEKLIGYARDAIGKLGRLSDADAREIARARKAHGDARESIGPTAALFDVLAASRLNEKVRSKIETGAASHWVEEKEPLIGTAIHAQAVKTFSEIEPFHFPVAFPEVFLRKRAGFDVIIGNPPWEKARVEEHGFWARYFPGWKGLAQKDREEHIGRLRKERPDLVKALEQEVAAAGLYREVLLRGPFPGMGSGDPDLYKAFCWRFWELACPGGRVGVVLPRSAFAAKGSEEFRKRLFEAGTVEDLTLLLNNRKWVFDDQHPQYTIALTGFKKTSPREDTTLPFRGPFSSLERFKAGALRPPIRFPAREVLTWTDTAALPLLPGEDSAEVFAQLRKAPRLDLNDGKSWRARPHTELHATNDKKLMKFSADRPEGYWPVFKGESFDIWEPDRGPASYYAWVDPDKIQAHLLSKQIRSGKLARSAFSEFPERWRRDKRNLPCLRPRIVFRDNSRATDSRTVRAALIPPRVFVCHLAPYLLFPRGDEQDQAFLLGVLCSIPLDWYARRLVELHLTYDVLSPFPIPRPPKNDSLWQRTVTLAGRLACPDRRFAGWGKAVGVECGPLDPNEKDDMIHELDAVVAHLYGLSEGNLRHIFETFHERSDYEARLNPTLKHYHSWSKFI